MGKIQNIYFLRKCNFYVTFRESNFIIALVVLPLLGMSNRVREEVGVDATGQVSQSTQAIEDQCFGTFSGAPLSYPGGGGNVAN